MKVLPVLDVLGGLAVHAVGGIRHDYQPLRVTGCRSSCPLEISRVIRERYELTDWYVADLDGIVHRRWNLSLLRELAASGLTLRIDWGLCDVEDLFEINGPCENSRCIVASEVLRDRTVLDSLVGMLDPLKLTFSLDLVDGELKCPPGAWGTMSLEEIIGYTRERGILEIIVLDMAYVGCKRGLGTGPVCARLREAYPDLTLITGGGVRTVAHLEQLERLGVDAVLLGSCLHQGELAPGEISRYSSPASLDATRSNTRG